MSRWKFCPFCGNRGARNMGTPYSIKDVAALTGWSRSTVIRMFKNVPGVLVLGRPETMHKRAYNSLRIPRHIYQRVMDGLEVKSGKGTNANKVYQKRA